MTVAPKPGPLQVMVNCCREVLEQTGPLEALMNCCRGVLEQALT